MDDTSHWFDEAGQLKHEHLNNLLVEVSSGRHMFQVGRTTYVTRWPRMRETDRARIVYAKRLQEGLSAGLMSRDHMEAMCISNGILLQEDRDRIDRLLEMVQHNAASREKTSDMNHRLVIDTEIAKLNDEIQRLDETRLVVLANSAEARAEQCRITYLTSACTMTGEFLEDPLWATWEAFQTEGRHHLVNAARRAFLDTVRGLPTKVLRGVVKSHEWRMRWRAAKDTHSALFEGTSVEWSPTQQAAIHWSDFYDSIRAHPESPSEAIINDDDALQSWLHRISMQNKSKQRGGGRTHYQRRGNGERVPMTKTGSATTVVNTPFRVRTSQDTHVPSA
jgi:hypothetical protein